MKKSTFTKTCLTMLALSLCTSLVFADTPDPEGRSTNAAVQYQLTLADYIKITSGGNKASETTFTDGYTGITINQGMTGHFDIISNAPTRKMNLKSSCPLAAGGQEAPLFGVTFTEDAQGNQTGTGTGVLIFTRTANSPTDESLKNIKGTQKDGQGSAIATAADANPNAIAFNVNFAKTYAHGLDDGGLVATFDAAQGAIEFDMTNGVSTLDITVTGSNVANTFNTKDQSGTYQATLTLTDGAL